MQKKEVTKKSYEDKGKVSYDQPLDDPVAEKLRLARCYLHTLVCPLSPLDLTQNTCTVPSISIRLKSPSEPRRLQEQSDLKAAMELFGIPELDLDTFVPKTAKGFEDLGRALSVRYLQPHERSVSYKHALKALLKQALTNADASLVKDLETSLAGLRSEKLKEEKAAAAAKKGAAPVLLIHDVIPISLEELECGKHETISMVSIVELCLKKWTNFPPLCSGWQEEDAQCGQERRLCWFG